MKKVLTYFTVLFSASLVMLTGCSSNTQNQNTTLGAVTGAVVGGVAGSAFGGGTGRAVAVGVGAVAGALLGGYVGHSMDSSDNSNMCNTMSNNPTNHSSSWKNKKSGARYTMKPTSNVFTYNGNSTCRKYQATAVVNGEKQTTDGVACKQSNGSWQTVS
jgi:surface antigen